MNFFTLKWGTKYDHNYVNRLFYSLKKHYTNSFNFYCITDDNIGICNDIKIIDYNEFNTLSNLPQNRLFTKEKTLLFKNFTAGSNIYLDLDILIYNDVTELFDQLKEKPVFIWNYWDTSYDPIEAIYNIEDNNCYLNGSIILWHGNNAEFIFDNMYNNIDKFLGLYNSLDKFIYREHWYKNHLLFWPENMVYRYNGKHYSDQKACLFNNSHGEGKDLHEIEGWVKDIWYSYDTTS